MTCVTARRPHDHHHAPAQKTSRDIAQLAIVKAIIRKNGVRLGENQDSVSEIKAALFESPLTLGKRKRDSH
jgi:hypothetical protein